MSISSIGLHSKVGVWHGWTNAHRHGTFVSVTDGHGHKSDMDWLGHFKFCSCPLIVGPQHKKKTSKLK